MTPAEALAQRRAELERRLAALPPEKRAQFERARTSAPLSPRRTGIAPREPGSPVPMSYAQELLWLLDRATPGMHGYNVPRSARLRGPLDLDALRFALDRIVERHEVLRSTFDIVDGEPRQIVHEPAPVTVEIVDVADRGSEAATAEASALVRERSRRPFDLTRDAQLRATLIRIGAEDHVLLLVSHHVSSDAWSRNILLRELAALYDAHRRGVDAALPALPIQYGDFASWQREHLQGETLERHLAYWREQLRGAPALLELPTDRPRSAMPSFEGAARSRLISRALLDQLRTLSRENGCTLFVTLLSAFDVLLARLSGQDDVVVGSPTAGRSNEATEGLIGYFGNTLVLRARLDGDPSFNGVVARMREVTLSAFEHQEVPFEKLALELQRERALGRSGLFQVMFTLQDADLQQMRLPGLGFEPFGGARGATKFDLSLFMQEREDGLRATFEYRSDLFDDSTVDRMLDQLEALLQGIVRAPATPISKLSIVADHERAKLIGELSRGPSLEVDAETLHEMIDRQVALTPDAVALERESASGRIERMTFRELNERADVVAAFLAAAGVGPNMGVGICIDRSFELVVAMLGVLKAGSYYLPLDPDYPADRLAFMLEDARVPVLLTVDALAGSLPSVEQGPRVVLLDRDWGEVAAAAAQGRRRSWTPTGDGLAYVIYTSGSTGRPKGVMIPHRAVVNYLAWMRDAFPLDTSDAVLQKAPASFDACIWEFFLPLVSGARLVLARASAHHDPIYLADAVAKHELTLLQLVPSQLQMMLETPGLDAGAALSRLRRLYLGGEALPSELLSRLGALCPELPVTNLYGPTEATVYATSWSVVAGEWQGGRVPIGSPIANVSVHVVQATAEGGTFIPELTPIGVPGELCIGGVGLAHGYLNRPELTDEKFVRSPFAARPGEMMYRTGDRVRLRPDGTLEYLGRIDTQVKLRGLRVELGEIESALRQIHGVQSAAVLMREDRAGDQRLVGYAIAEPGAERSRLETPELRTALKRTLPEFMVPSAFVWLTEWPLNPNGKLDRAALPAPAGTNKRRAYKPPRTTIEHELVQIWESLLGVKPIGMYDDFFELGGHSLLAVRMLVEVERARGRPIPLTWLFESSTIESLAARIDDEVQGTREPPLITLQAEGKGTPVAFVHGDVRGAGWYCRRLAPLMAPESPMHVLPTLGSDKDAELWTIETMAARHISELRKVQPHGPYRLVGFCVGGKIVLEMAQQLQALGETVDRLVVIDSGAGNAAVTYMRPFLPLIRRADPFEQMALRADIMGRVRWYDARVRLIARKGLREKARWMWSNIARRVRNVVHLFRHTTLGDPMPEPTVVEETLLQGVLDLTEVAGEQVLLRQACAVGVYFPRRYQGPIDVIFAEERPNVKRFDPTRGWWRITDKVHVHSIVAHHLDLITNRLPELASVLRGILERESD